MYLYSLFCGLVTCRPSAIFLLLSLYPSSAPLRYTLLFPDTCCTPDNWQYCDGWEDLSLLLLHFFSRNLAKIHDTHVLRLSTGSISLVCLPDYCIDLGGGTNTLTLNEVVFLARLRAP